MKNALILHGTENDSSGNWFQWLKKQLESRGFEVWVPDLPNSEMPDAEKYNNLLLNHGFIFNEETVLVGHSSGAVSILNLLAELPADVKIRAAFLVGAFKGPLNKETRSKLFPKPFNFEQLKTHCNKFVFVHSDNDPYCPLSDAEFLANKLDGDLMVKKGQGHFNLDASPNYKQFPVLLELIKKEIGN